MSDEGSFEAPNFMLQKGGFLPVARLAYKTLGTLNATRDNAVLVPSWYTGTHDDTEMFMVAPERALDPGKYFIILTDLLANGLSSSPSNTVMPFGLEMFPKITMQDNVTLQYRMLREKLGIERLRLVTGWSMGRVRPINERRSIPICSVPRRSNSTTSLDSRSTRMVP